MVKLRLLLVLSAVAGLLPTAAAGSGGTARWFFTPGPEGAGCQLELNRPGTSALCQAYRAGRPYRTAVGAEMTASGKLTICHGCISNFPERTPTLAVGRSIELGPFRCTSLRVGVRCIVKKLGRGFQLSTRGVQRI